MPQVTIAPPEPAQQPPPVAILDRVGDDLARSARMSPQGLSRNPRTRSIMDLPDAADGGKALTDRCGNRIYRVPNCEDINEQFSYKFATHDYKLKNMAPGAWALVQRGNAFAKNIKDYEFNTPEGYIMRGNGSMLWACLRSYWDAEQKQNQDNAIAAMKSTLPRKMGGDGNFTGSDSQAVGGLGPSGSVGGGLT